MNNEEILSIFIGKEIRDIAFDPQYEMKITFTDGSILQMIARGPQGSKLEAQVEVKLVKTL